MPSREHDADESSPTLADRAADDVGGSDVSVERSEEEAWAETRKREAGSMNVHKSVRTERGEVRVPKRREEVGIERTSVNREAPGAEIGEDEVVVQVFDEEVVVSKRVVLKEEIRIRKTVVEEEEVVEVDLRKEEVEIDDRTERGARNNNLAEETRHRTGGVEGE